MIKIKKTIAKVISEYAIAIQANLNLLNPLTPTGLSTRFGPVITPDKKASSNQPQIHKEDIKAKYTAFTETSVKLERNP